MMPSRSELTYPWGDPIETHQSPATCRHSQVTWLVTWQVLQSNYSNSQGCLFSHFSSTIFLLVKQNYILLFKKHTTCVSVNM